MITVTIAGVDKSTSIIWDSLEVEQQLTSQVDTCRFRIRKHAGKTYAPSIGDTVVVTDDSTDIFGGTIDKITDMVEAGLLTYLDISCVGHERTLDRFLAVREFDDVSARYILAALMDEFANQPGKEIDLGESTETWVQEDGTVAANTTSGQFIQGDQSRKHTATAGSTATSRRVTTLDLTTFSDGSAAGTDAYVQVWYYVDNPTNFASLRIRFVSDGGATYTNYFQYTINTTPRTGWNQAMILKSAFSSTGSPSWSSNLKRQYRVTASGSGTVNVSIDDVRLLPSSPFTMANVVDADTPNLGSAKFNYEQVSDAIKQIAEAVGCDWYIDPDKDLHFFAPSTEPAPFSLSDTSKSFIWDSLKLSADLATIKNRVIVRGGKYQGASTDYDVIADGTQLTFRSPYQIKNIAIYVDDGGGFDPKTVGVDNLDDPASFDCLYNFQEKTLKFTAATKPAAGYTVRMSGNPMVPVIVKRDDPTSIASYGVFEFLIIDQSIVTQQGARDRAMAELRAYRDQLTEGSFLTDTAGLRAGQTISINITARGISDTYVISSVTFRPQTPTALLYEAKIVSTRTFGIIEYLIGLLRGTKKQIALSDDEVVDYVTDISETITVSDSISGNANLQSFSDTASIADSFQSQLNHGTTFVYAPYTPSGFSDTKRPFVLDGSPLA